MDHLDHHDSDGHDHGHGPGHTHAIGKDADRRYLTGALLLITGFMAVEVIVGLIARSLALISDAGHMLTDAASIVFALIAMRLAARPARGRYTWGLKRAEILSAQLNGLTLLALAAYFTYAGIQRLIHPPEVEGMLVMVTGAVGIVVNIAATWLISKANRSSLNVEGAFQHLLNDLYAFIGTTLAGVVVWLTGFARADAVAALLVAALMLKAGWELVRASGRVFLEAAPAGLDPDAIGAQAAALPGVSEIHDLHIWEVTSGYPAASAHLLVTADTDCHTARRAAEELLRDTYGISHLTLQVDHAPADDRASSPAHCADPHGPVHRPEGPTWPTIRLQPSA
ncbi:cation diffusion facilitator family transporter [Streptomyces sp. CdTB01]|uniref:cation diffusion facilitator family transporter n=1 Tax=Streptomyces sp. CdTB01 TaxID=1725411 RepID=UPI00073A62C3|nr:cation diffusion facilitator family transporter [Streptomyces sp. CdTB01]ALV39208.1 cation diffusion facilitator family transporter [Streptomyces sp. CdTB01]